MATKRATKNGVITDVERVTELVSQYSGINYSENDIIYMVDNSNDVVYLSSKGEEISANFANNAFIKINAFTKFGESLYVAMYRTNSNYKKSSISSWEGFYVGTYSKLYKQLFSDLADEQSDAFTDVLADIYGRLLDKEHWEASHKLSRLSSYLYAIYSRCVKQSSVTPEVITESTDHEKHCFNTKLLDVYGNFIYLACDRRDDGKIRNAKVLVSKSDYIRNGFTGERPVPVSFFDDIKDVVFQGNLNEFDLEDTQRLSHLIENSHKQRLPKEYQDITAVDMASSVKYSIEMALKMLATDYRYIVPMYNIKYNKIQFLVPLYLKKEYSEIPEVALIISKNDVTGLYVVITLLDIGLAYTNSRVISASTASWLERAMANRQLSDAEEVEVEVDA